MGKVGRPITKTGAAAKAKRDAARAAYNKLPLSKRKALVQNRDQAAQRAASKRRDQRDRADRREYHAEQRQAMKNAPSKPATCQWPGCNRTDIEFHHQGIDKWLCSTHHAEARRRANGGR